MGLIVCTVDLSAASEVPVAWASVLARRMKADLCLFHAVHTPSDSLHPSAEFERGGELRQRQETGRARMARLMASIDLPCRTEIVFGEPAEMLQHYCRKQKVDLVIARSQGVKGLKRLLYGTIVERMVRMINCPLLALHPKASQDVNIHRIGICHDLTDKCLGLAEYAFALAHAFGARIDVMHTLVSAIGPEAQEPTASSYEMAQQAMQQALQKQLLAILPRTGHEAIQVAAHVAMGASHELVPELAGDLHTDILITGVRPHSVIGKWVIGSTTEAVLRKAPCHVLTVPL
jgi:nucleotide-binding universal stress UspA family protein